MNPAGEGLGSWQSEQGPVVTPGAQAAARQMSNNMAPN